MKFAIVGILVIGCVLVQLCACQPPRRRPSWGRSSSVRATDRNQKTIFTWSSQFTAPREDCFLVPYEYDNGNVIHSTLFCSRGAVSNTDAACITSLFKRCDTSQSPGIVIGAGAKRQYFIQEGDTNHCISFYNDPTSDGELCIYYTLEDCRTIKGGKAAPMMSTKMNRSYYYTQPPPRPGR